MQVQYDSVNQMWDVTWKDTRCRLRLANGLLMNETFGPHDRPGAKPDSAPYADGLLETRTMVNVGLAPHGRTVLWQLDGWSQPDSAKCSLRLRAVDGPLQAELTLEVDKESGVLICHAELVNAGAGEPVDIDHAVSVCVLLPADVGEVIHLAGRWGAETQVQRTALARTALVLESRTGKTGFEYAPYAAMLAPEHAYVIELLWSGNWEMQVRRLFDGRVAVSAGLNDWGLRHRLGPGDRLALPDVFLLCVKGGLNAVTQRLHRYRRHFPVSDNQRPVPVQYNSWYAFSEQVPAEQMMQAAAAAAELGCEVFVLDAGWYTTEVENPADGWWIRTGDWVVNRKWYPNGLEELSGFCHARGIDFGLWFEPEAVGPSAVIRREHPEWLHAIGGAVTPPGERAVLNLGVPAARAYIRERILAVLRAAKADWMKWDFNTDLRQGGWAPDTPDELARQDPLIAHYHGLYQLQAEIRQALPSLMIEMCAGGGGRFDPAILACSHVNWMSDQTNALMNLAIHFGSQLAHCAFECNDWLVEWPPHSGVGGEVDYRGDLPFRTRVAMLGSFGLSAPLDHWSDEDMAVVKTHVDWYKQIIQPIILNGDQYLLTDAPPLDGNGDWAVVWYAARDRERGVLFAFRLAGGDPQRVFSLPGLMPQAFYRLRTPEGWTATRTGAELEEGLLIDIDELFRSELIYVEHAGSA